uniref:Uncharacterized protein n=1 Tax=Opuntia streptacantha TaxID=393608 RepID=A0A7C9DGW3_OPUST
MATAPVKSPLHNFPPTFLKWGSKSPHHHRCRRNSPFDSPPPPPPEDIDKSKAAEPEPEAEAEGEKPWNLRPRRTPTSVSSSMAKIASSEAPENLPKSMRLRGFDYHGGGGGGDKRFWIALSKDEIEEDIYAFTASKPSRRPKKRPKNVQKQLDNMFPGLRLVGFSADTYRGLYAPPNR